MYTTKQKARTMLNSKNGVYPPPFFWFFPAYYPCCIDFSLVSYHHPITATLMLCSVLDKKKQTNSRIDARVCMPVCLSILQSKNRMGYFPGSQGKEGAMRKKNEPPDNPPIPSFASISSFSPVLQYSLLVLLFSTPSVLFLPCVFDQNPRKMFNAQWLDAKWEEVSRSRDPSLPISLVLPRKKSRPAFQWTLLASRAPV